MGIVGQERPTYGPIERLSFELFCCLLRVLCNVNCDLRRVTSEDRFPVGRTAREAGDQIHRRGNEVEKRRGPSYKENGVAWDQGRRADGTFGAGEERQVTPRLIGEHPLAKDSAGRLKSCIGTVFPGDNVVVTLPGMSHMMQRQAYVDKLDQERAGRGAPELDEAQRRQKWFQAVDLIMEQQVQVKPAKAGSGDAESADEASAGCPEATLADRAGDPTCPREQQLSEDCVFIRPDPDEMNLAFQADELLRDLEPPVPAWQTRFQAVRNAQVHEAIKCRGQCWRITPLPRSSEHMGQMIAAAKTKLGGKEVYYYNKTRGTRLLTCGEFQQLGELAPESLRQHLLEIQKFSGEHNRQGNPEIGFFLAGDRFSAGDLAEIDFSQLDGDRLRAAHRALAAKFTQAVPAELRRDDRGDANWRGRMFGALVGESDEVVPEETLLGLSSEFFMQIQWLPGARFDTGELLLDPCFLESGSVPRHLGSCHENTLGFIFNFVREYGQLEYVNIGQVVDTMSKRGKLEGKSDGRREVYIAVLKTLDSDQEVVKMIRMQKRGVREHLDSGEDLLQALLKSDRYTEYVLDRRLACRQLGMNLTQRILARKLAERYYGDQTRYHGIEILTPYFERDYIAGIASDKLPESRFKRPAYAIAFARLLGRAAAANLIVGRCGRERTDADKTSGRVVFDDGDELVVEAADGLPSEILLADQMGTFNNCTTPLAEFGEAYADPVKRRLASLSDPGSFAEAYLDGLATRFLEIQEHYTRFRSAFDALFRHRRLGSGARMALRWTEVLRRLDETKPADVIAAIRKHLPASRTRNKSASAKE